MCWRVAMCTTPNSTACRSPWARCARRPISRSRRPMCCRLGGKGRTRCLSLLAPQQGRTAPAGVKEADAEIRARSAVPAGSRRLTGWTKPAACWPRTWCAVTQRPRTTDTGSMSAAWLLLCCSALRGLPAGARNLPRRNLSRQRLRSLRSRSDARAACGFFSTTCDGRPYGYFGTLDAALGEQGQAAGLCDERRDVSRRPRAGWPLRRKRQRTCSA